MHLVSINNRIEQIRENEVETSRFIEEYKPFIASCTEKVTGRFMRYGLDDELSIALIAFQEAIKAYDKSKGSFLSFARRVISLRLIDYYRKEKKNSNLVPLTTYDNENEGEIDLSLQQSLDMYNESEANEYRRLEIKELSEELLKWGITFSSIAEASPKHKNTRKLYFLVIKFLLSRDDLIRYIKAKKQLPLAEIEKYLRIPRKKVERGRKYIIVVLIILTGDYYYIKDYVSWGVKQ